MAEPFVLGVNYWPRRKAMGWWKDFDGGEVREEFALIRELGLGVVRLFLLWEDFQPTPEAVSGEALANLETVCDAAADLGLRLDVTFFTGHMSGPNWSPGWLLGGSTYPSPFVNQVISVGRAVPDFYRNMFTDPAALHAERLLLSTVVGRLRDHAAIWMWNLGNEPDLFALPPGAAAGRAWVREMVGVIKGIDPAHPVTCGLHNVSLLMDPGLRVHDVFAETDVAVMHSYPMYAPWAHGPLDPDMVPYTCALTSALCGKPTLMEEFGGPTAPPGHDSFVWKWQAYGKPHEQFMASEEALAEYIEAVLPGLVEVGATGALVWCFADYHESLWDQPPCDHAWHERFFGLVRPDGSLKPHAEVLQRFAASQPTVLEQPTRTLELDITPDEYYLTGANVNLVRLYRRFTEG